MIRLLQIGIALFLVSLLWDMRPNATFSEVTSVLESVNAD